MSAGVVISQGSRHTQDVFQDTVRALRPYMDDPLVQEIMVNRPDDIWVERGGSFQRVDVTLSERDVDGAIRSLARLNDKDVAPVLDCRMPGFRVAAARSPVAINGSSLCIRKHAKTRRTLDTYLEAGGFDPLPPGMRVVEQEQPPNYEAAKGGGQPLRDLLGWMVRTRKNILIAGATGSGKTTFLNALLDEVPHDNRVLTIEDTAELQVSVPNYVGLEAAPDQGITIRSLVKLALRYRPDRIIVGEVRGPETYDLLDAMNTGHSGGACSIHADTAEQALTRIENLVRMNPDTSNLPHLALKNQIATTFDYVIFCSRRGARRGPEQVVAVQGITDTGYLTQTIFDARQ